jgi:hypothetical protein
MLQRQFSFGSGKQTLWRDSCTAKGFCSYSPSSEIKMNAWAGVNAWNAGSTVACYGFCFCWGIYDNNIVTYIMESIAVIVF